jgi:tRNA pseudouridine32 synthase/23S rRNA pseudouridine746 synthase
MKTLEQTRRVDFAVPAYQADAQCSVDYLWGPARGKMFGVLIARTATGKRVHLRAFSGQYNGLWQVPGWVNPVFNLKAFHKIHDQEEQAIKKLSAIINNLSPGIPERQERVLLRKKKSQQLMRAIHSLYRLHNFHGQIADLEQVFASGTDKNGLPPTGTGDCCAPKLLQHAALHNLTPLALAEFYLGKENRSGTRQHGCFYPSCQEKCYPILGFMLCGAEQQREKVKSQKRMNKELEIIFADQQLVVVNKPGGLLAVPGRGSDKQDCVTSRVKELFPRAIDQPAVHRLDMATSGLMVLALTTEAHRHLSCQFSQRQVDKVYIALLDGAVDAIQGEIELRFRLDPENRPFQVYDPVQGKSGLTRWQRLEVSTNDQGSQTRVQFIPLTGRTHQLRLHAAHSLGLGCPIIGDNLYGSGQMGDPMYLHATRLAFNHPGNNKKLEFYSAPPF